MGLLSRRKTGKTLLYETRIYERFENWFEDTGEIKEPELRDRIESARGSYQRELIKESRKKDFLRSFIVTCELACQNIYTEDKEKKGLTDFISDVIGSVIGDVICETTEIKKLNKIVTYLENTYEDEDKNEFTTWIKDRRNGKMWILDTFIDTTIKTVILKNLKEDYIEEIPDKWKMTFGENAKYDFALFSGTSLTEVKSMLAYGISRTYLHNIFYGLIMLRILMDALKDDSVKDDPLYPLYITWLGDEDLFTGYSGLNHFFDGIIILEKKDKENPWLLKCISTYYNPSDAIESIDAKLEDIGVKKCILFVPAYPSQNALRHSLYTYATKKHEVILLYLHDLYTMINMEDKMIKDYLIGRRIK
jgi:hypothetical protein